MRLEARAGSIAHAGHERLRHSLHGMHVALELCHIGARQHLIRSLEPRSV